MCLSSQYGFPYLDLSNFKIDKNIINLIPAAIAEKYCLIPIDKIGKSLSLAMADPLNVHAVEDVELITGCAVQTFVSTASDIRESINKYYQTK